MSRRSFRSEQQQFVVDGPVLLREAIEYGGLVREVFVRRDLLDEVVAACQDTQGVQIFVLDDKAFNDVSDQVSPRGVMSVCDRPTTTAVGEIDGWVLVAHEVSDPGNVGTLMRSAEASGAHALVVTGGSADPFAPKTVRSSAGAIFHVPVVEVKSLDEVKRAGFELVGTTSHIHDGHTHDGTDGARVQSMYDADFSGRLAVVMGNEAHGLDPQAPIDRWVTVPHRGRSESLNVAMAGTALAMHVAHVRSDT